MTSKRVSLATNSLVNFAGYFATIILGIISFPIIIGKIGITSVGVYALMSAILAPMDLINLGFSEATIKYVAYYRNLDNSQAIKQYLSTTLLMNIGVGIIGMLIISLTGPPVAFKFFDFESEKYSTIQQCFFLVGVNWLVRQLTTFWMAIPNAMERFKIVAFGNLVTSVLTTLAVIGWIYHESNLVGYVTGTLIGALTSLVVWIVIVRYNFPMLSYSLQPSKEAWMTSFKYGGWRTISSLGAILTTQADKYVLGLYLPASSSGVYNTVLQIQQRILSGVWKLAEVLFPSFSATIDQVEEQKYKRLLDANYLITVIGVIFFSPLIIFSDSLLRIWIDAEFAKQGATIAQCLSLIGVFASLSVVQVFFLNANGRVKQTTFITYYTGIATIIGSLTFIPLYGLNGVGFGVLFAAATRIFFFFFYIKKEFASHFNWKTYLAATLYPITIGAIIVTAFLIFAKFQPLNIYELAIDCTFVLSILVATLWAANFLTPHTEKYNTLIRNLILRIIG